MKRILIWLTMIFITNPLWANPTVEIPKDVNILVPYGPGGISDIQVRHLSLWLAKKGINLNPIYKPGGNSTIAANELATSNKDGSVLMINSTSNSWLARERLGREVIDPIVTTGGNANAFITFPGSRYENYNDFVRILKSNDPETKIGWHAVANLINLNQLVEKLEAPKPLLIPYKTSTESSRDVAGKHIPLALVPMSTALPLAESGKVKIIFGFSAGKSGLPTGVLDLKSKISSWQHGELFFIGLPPGTDKKVHNAWSTLLKEYLNDKQTEDTYTKAYFGKDVGDREYVFEVINRQSELIKKYKIEFK
jgi:tripartite-type tricarboxylate transporter receptor subunit TctC